MPLLLTLELINSLHLTNTYLHFYKWMCSFNGIPLCLHKVWYPIRFFRNEYWNCWSTGYISTLLLITRSMLPSYKYYSWRGCTATVFYTSLVSHTGRTSKCVRLSLLYISAVYYTSNGGSLPYIGGEHLRSEDNRGYCPIQY